jgi:hypothetical protein
MGEESALFKGETSRESLGRVFCLWLRDCRDLSEWDNAPLFAAIVHEYSDLKLATVAVWLSLDPSEVQDVAVPTSPPPWTFPGPTGESLTLDRRVVTIGDDD